MNFSFRGIWDMITGKSRGANQVYRWSDRAARWANYSKFFECYHGRIYRGGTDGTYSYVNQSQMKRLVFNFAVPICNTGAAWLAGPDVSFSVVTQGQEGESEDAIEARMEKDRMYGAKLSAIWDRSGSCNEFMDAALSCCIYGDVGITVRRQNSEAYIVFHEPGICDPYFSPHDSRVLDGMTIAYPVEERGETVPYVEEWTRGVVTTTVGENEPDVMVLKWAGDECPALWVRNEAVKGREFGVSDIDAPFQAICEYDHIAGKQTRIIDYYSAPAIVVKGGVDPDGTIEKNVRTVWTVAEGGDVKFLEWSGTAPGVPEHLELIRRGISEMTEIPEVAFGKVDQGFTHASGVSMKVLYGPLENKIRRKRAQWGPALERAMWLALRAEGVMDVPLSAIKINWGECAPHSESEFLTDLETKMRLGLSSRTALREMQYTEDEIKMIESERDSEQEKAAELEAKANPKPVPGKKEVK